MEIAHLKAFVMIAKTRQITKASQNLHISQPAISAHIKSLENEIGVTLFNRIASGMQITEIGKLLLDKAESILDDITSFKHLASEFQHEVSAQISLGLPSDSALDMISDFIAGCTLNYENLNFELSEMHSGSIIEKIIDKSLDAGFVLGPVSHSRLKCVPLSANKLFVVGPINYADKFNSITSWQDIAKLPWIYTSEQCGHYRTIKHFFKTNNLAMPGQYMRADSPTLLLKFLQHKLGVSLMPEVDAMDFESKGIISVWRHQPLAVQESFIYNKDKHGDPIIEIILNAIPEHWSLN